MNRTAIVVPCYNEAKRFAISDYEHYISEHEVDRYFIFVDDGSTDTTQKVLSELSLKYPKNVEVLHLKKNQGKAEAVRLGIIKAIDNPENTFIGFWDADLATPLEAIDDFIELLASSSQTQLVMGARCKLLGRSVQRKLARHYLGRVFATVVSVTLRLGVYDTQCGAKIFRNSDSTKDLFATKFCTKWIFDVEIIVRYIKAKGRKEVESSIYEYPLKKWHHIEGSKVKTKDFFKAFFELIAIYRLYLKN